MQYLSRLPRNSLGYASYNLLTHQGYALIPKFESHDFFHVLLGYEMTVKDEARMQWCLLGNGKYSLFVLGTVALSIVCMPECWSLFLSDYKKGKKMKPVWRINYDVYVRKSLKHIKKELNISI